MTVRADKFSPAERVIWVCLGAILMLAEVRVLYLDRTKTEADQSSERKQQQVRFEETVHGFEAILGQNREHLDKTMGGISQEINTFTGGESYLVLSYVPGQGFLDFGQRGKYTVFGASARIVNLDNLANIYGTVIEMGVDVTRGHAMMKPIPPELNKNVESMNLNIFFTARNGDWLEQLRVRRIKGGWTRAIRIRGRFSTLTKEATICESINKDFPVETLDKDFNVVPLNPKLPRCSP